MRSSVARVCAISSGVVLAAASAPIGRATAAPASNTLAIYAYDSAHHTVVHESPDGGTPTTLMSNVEVVDRIVVDAQHNVYVVGGGGVTKIAAGGGAPVAFRTDLDPTDIAADGPGNVYVSSRAKGAVVRIATNGAESVIAGTTVGPVSVDTVGNVAQVGASDDEYAAVVFGRAGTTSVTQLVQTGGRTESLQSGSGRQAYLAVSAGDSYTPTWLRVRRSGVATTLGDHPANTAACTGPDGTFYLAESTQPCVSDKPCTAAMKAVRKVLRYPANGAKPRSIAVSGLSLSQPVYPESPGVPNLAADRAGNLYTGYLDTKTPKLLKYAPSGGAPKVLTSGTFQNVTVG